MSYMVLKISSQLPKNHATNSRDILTNVYSTELRFEAPLYRFLGIDFKLSP